METILEITESTGAGGRMLDGELPSGLSHPYGRNTAACATYRGGHTFTWTRGDDWIAVQRGRVANASQSRLIKDAHPSVPPIYGWRPIIAAIPAPAPQLWQGSEEIVTVADAWLTARREQERRKALQL
ncbi:hypothetical protein [Amycolatopsis sp. NPDC059021]|uniref:hypothetical protein n=1 Tax=Amycolatopsis sp. NPDC059021 TaxID=3346704 RepID=UPI0036728CFB